MSEDTPIPPSPEGPQGQGPLPYETPGAASIEMNKDARTWGMFCHLAAFAGYLIPFGNIIGPLIIWLVKKEEYPFVDDQGKESLNFQITMMIAAIISALLICIVIGFFLLLAVVIIDVIFIIIATVKANKGIWYRYPFALRLIK